MFSSTSYKDSNRFWVTTSLYKGHCFITDLDLAVRGFDSIPEAFPCDDAEVNWHPTGTRREPWNNYVPTLLADRYDAFVFLPYTRALEPLRAEQPLRDDN